MLVYWRRHVDRQIADIRAELGITPVLPDGKWDQTNRLCNEDDPHFGAPGLLFTGSYERGRTYGVELGVNF